MKFTYKALTQEGVVSEGIIEEMSKDAAVIALQKKSLVVVFVDEQKELIPQINFNNLHVGSFFKKKIKVKDVVIFSRQIATLFEAGVSALKAFRMLAEENENETLRKELTEVADDIQTGVSLSKAMETHIDIFSPFYISMVRAGEESGKLNESFLYLADYLDRDYELTQKTKKALTYPAFVIGTFVIIMTVMFVFVIPKMAAMFADQRSQLPAITVFILGISSFLQHFGPYILPVIIGGVWWFSRYAKTPEGRFMVDTWKTKAPVFKTLFEKMFLTRLSDNMNTMLSSGVSIIRSIEITADVVDNEVYKALLLRVVEKIKMGTPFSKALYEEELVPNILIQMVKVGEETGELGYILKNLAKFYKREVDDAIDSVIGLIEPAMIVGLGLGVGILVSAVLLPMYSLSSQIN